MNILSFIGSAMFVFGTFSKKEKKMRIFYLLGAIILASIFASNGLNNAINISQFILNVLNAIIHIYYLSADYRKRRNYKKLIHKVDIMSKVA